MKNYFLKLFIVAAVIAAFAVSCGTSTNVEASVSLGTGTQEEPPVPEELAPPQVAIATTEELPVPEELAAPQAAIATTEERAAFDAAKEEALLVRSLIVELRVSGEFQDEWDTIEATFNMIPTSASDASGSVVEDATERYRGAFDAYNALFLKIFDMYKQTQETAINAAQASIEGIISTGEFSEDRQNAELRFNGVKSRSIVPATVDEVKEVKGAYAEAADLYRNLIQNIVPKYQDEINTKRSLLVEIGIPPEQEEEWEQTELKFTGYVPSSSAPTLDESREEVAFYAETAAEYDNWFERIYPYANTTPELTARARGAFPNLRETIDAVAAATPSIDASVELAIAESDALPSDVDVNTNAPAIATSESDDEYQGAETGVVGEEIEQDPSLSGATPEPSADDIERLEAAKDKVRGLRSLGVELLTQLPEEWNQEDLVYIVDPDSILPDDLSLEELQLKLKQLEEAASVYEGLLKEPLEDFVREQKEQVDSLSELALDAGAEDGTHRLSDHLAAADIARDKIGDTVVPENYADAKNTYAIVQAMYRIVAKELKALDVQKKIESKKLSQWDSEGFDSIDNTARAVMQGYTNIVQDAETAETNTDNVLKRYTALEAEADGVLKEFTDFFDTYIVEYAEKEFERAYEIVSDADLDSAFAKDFEAAQMEYESAPLASEAAGDIYMQAGTMFEDVYKRALTAFAQKQDESVDSLRKLTEERIELEGVEAVFQKYLDLADKTTVAIADILDGKPRDDIEEILNGGEKSVYARAKELYAIVAGIYQFLPEAVQVHLIRGDMINKGLASLNIDGFDKIDAFERSVMDEYNTRFDAIKAFGRRVAEYTSESYESIPEAERDSFTAGDYTDKKRLIPAAEKAIVTVKERYFDFYADTIDDYAQKQKGIASSKREAALAAKADSTVKDVFDGAEQVFNDADLILSHDDFEEAADRYIQAAERFDAVLAAAADRMKPSQDLLGKAKAKVIESKDLARDAEISVQGVTQW
ncbi:hypothetical protein ACYULU_03760 [Breznakiellaceae bacterium SP9]